MTTQRKKDSTSTIAAKSVKKQARTTKLADGLTQLGDKPTAPAKKSLEVFANPQPRRDFVIHMQIPEFTCLCPITGQPDFATLYLDYIPDARCVELKSLKLYIWSFRDQGIFHEHVTNLILDDLVEALDPHWCKITADFAQRGGVSIVVTAEHTRPESK